MEVSAVLFDFFGTLVEYQPDRSRLGYPATHRLATALGYTRDADRFVEDWDAASKELEDRAARTLREFSMTAAARAFADRVELTIAPALAVELGDSFVGEWRRHVHPIDGVADTIRRLANRYRLGIVSNTHDADMVPSMLGSMGVAECFDVVVLSVEHGNLKPHESIYRSALNELDVDSSKVVFVGDSFEPDYAAPTELGMAAFLIDPDLRHPISSEVRLQSILDVEARLAAAATRHGRLS